MPWYRTAALVGVSIPISRAKSRSTIIHGKNCPATDQASTVIYSNPQFVNSTYPEKPISESRKIMKNPCIPGKSIRQSTSHSFNRSLGLHTGPKSFWIDENHAVPPNESAVRSYYMLTMKKIEKGYKRIIYYYIYIYILIYNIISTSRFHLEISNSSNSHEHLSAGTDRCWW